MPNVNRLNTNPTGRPKGSVNRTKLELAEKLKENEDEFIECLMKFVRQGDPTAMKLWAAYAWGLPAQKTETVVTTNQLPQIVIQAPSEVVDVKHIEK
jgi:hypothetical protein